MEKQRVCARGPNPVRSNDEIRDCKQALVEKAKASREEILSEGSVGSMPIQPKPPVTQDKPVLVAEKKSKKSR